MAAKSSTSPTLLETTEPQALTSAPVTDVMQMFDRWVSDPNASVEKIERLMALWERNQAKIAEAAFNRAMSAAQKAMRPVAADAYNPQTRSKYASYEALDRALRPIYTEHGFGLTFNTADCPLPDHLRLTCKATHDDGHAEFYRLDMPADGKGAKGGDVMTKTHATGSAVSYGQRYLLKMIFNIAVGEEDDDGVQATATNKAGPPAPEGYDEWLTNLTAAAAFSWAKYKEVWNPDYFAAFRDHLVRTDNKLSTSLRKQAEAKK